MALKRTKRMDIYNTAGGFYGGGVEYAAHAILNDGTAILLQDAVAGAGNQNLATNHPDQLYWTDNAVRIRLRIGANAGNIRRIEIDCALLPCTGQGGCLDRVPALIRGLYPDGRLNNVALRIFSSRREFADGALPAGDKSDHRYFDTVATHGTNQTTAYNGHQGWGWVTTGFNDRQYAEDYRAII